MRYCAQKSSRETTSSDLASLGHLPLRGRLIRPKRNDEKQWFRRKPVLLCKAPASTAKPWDFHHSVGNAAGIMPVQTINKVGNSLRGCMKGPPPLHMKSTAATCAPRGVGACRAQWAIQTGGAPGIARSAIGATMRAPRKAASRFRYHLECARRAREK